MSPSRKKGEPQGRRVDWIEVITGRVGKITGLLTTLGALTAVMVSQFEHVAKGLADLGLLAPVACVEVSKPNIPATIEFSEWENMRIRFGGRNNCEGVLGLYVTFQGRVSSEPRFRVRPPHEDLTECSGSAPVQMPKCWDRKKPVVIGKGEWDWVVQPPPLLPLSDPTPRATISVRWDVRNVDQPDNPPLATDSAQIVVTNKAARP